MKLRFSLFSIILTTLMLLHIVSAMAEESASSSGFKEGIEFLNAIGIIDEAPDDINPVYGVTRAEFVKAVARIFGNSPDDGTLVQSYYTDMSVMDTESVRAVNMLTDLGLVSGVGGGTFEPDNGTKSEQAIKILVCALGYEVEALNSGGYPFGYMTVASRLGLTDGVSISGGEILTWEAFIPLLENTLAADVLQTTHYGINPEYKVIKGETLLNTVMNVTLLEQAKITANHITNINGTEGVKWGYAQIDGVLCYDPEGMATEAIGKTADVYVTETPDGKNTVLFVRLSYNAIRIDLEDITELDGYQVRYYEESGKEKKITLSKDAAFLYNNYACAYNPKAIELDKNGYILIEKNEVTAEYDMISAYVYSNIIVAAVDYDGMLVFDKIIPGKRLDLSDYISSGKCFITRDSLSEDINAISAGCVLSVFEAPSGEHISITVSDNSVSGIIASVDENGVGIGADVYPYYESLEADFRQYMRSACVAYVDHTGEIVWFTTVDDSLMKYAYLIATAQPNGLDSRLMLRIIADDGLPSELCIGKKITLNGERVSTNADEKVKSVIFKNGILNRQLIKYCVNSDGEITTLMTADFSAVVDTGKYSGNGFNCAIAKQEILFRNGANSFYGKFAIDSDTRIFVVPPEGTADVEDYSVQTVSYFDNNTNYTVEAYDLDLGGVADAMICWAEVSNARPDNRSPLVMVDRISDVTDEGGNQVKKLYCLGDGKFAEYITNGVVELSNGTRPLKRGDVIRLAFDQKGRISGIIADVDVDTQKYSDSSFSSFWASNWAFSGAVYSKEGSYALVSGTTSGILSDIFENPGYGELYSVPLTGDIMIYDEAQDMVYTGNINDILTYEAAGENASRFFMKLRYATVDNIFVFKYE